MADELGCVGMGDEDPEQRRIEDQQERRSGPDAQHELALDVVSDLDLFLVVAVAWLTWS